ncbi:MAG: hypothetical protein FWD36_03070 [Treponema sp.]|nr:hypothetical protein [Treponema sp.]
MLIIVSEIGSLLHKEFNGNFNKTSAKHFFNNISDIVKKYNEYFNNPKNTIVDFKYNFDDFFNLLMSFRKNINISSPALIDDCEKLTSSLRDFFDNILIDTFYSSPNRKIKEQEEIKIENSKKLLFILFVLYYCLSKTEKYRNYQFLFFIDNIENAIEEVETTKRTRILISDVSIIFTSILLSAKQSSQYITRMLEKLELPKSSPNSCVLLTMRDTTDCFFQKIKESIHIEESRYINIDITSYFDAESILKKKIKYYFNIDVKNCNGIEDDVKSALTAYYNIVSDKSKSKWCLGGFVQEFYNYHHRNIARNIIKIILSNKKEIQVFMKNWKIISETKGKERSTAAFTNYKHIVRQFFIRLLLGYVNQPKDDVKGIFEQLKEQPHYYTRRVLTYLHNESLIKDDFINTNKLIRRTLVKPNVVNLSKYNNVSSNNIRELTQALYIMNRTDPKKTSWTNLICIETPGGKYLGKESLLKLIYENWEKHLDYEKESKKLPEDFPHVTINITYAGKLYVWFMAEFEYFACRYAKKYPALFMAKNSNELESIIAPVTAATLRDEKIDGKDPCIYGHLKNECPFLENLSRGYLNPAWLYKEAKGISGQVHPKRILNRHNVYIKKFLKYLKSSYYNKTVKEAEREKMKNYLKNVIEAYKKRNSDLLKDYKDYMELG